MKIIVIGLGSMGRRRIRLLREHQEIEIFGVDNNIERANQVRETLGIKCFSSIDEVLEKEEIVAALICTSPLSHASIISTCLSHSLHVFTEINLVSQDYQENLRLSKEKNVVLFLSSTFLYRKETSKIIERVKTTDVGKLNYIYHVGQYLPDWHPWESYNDYFIGEVRTNGCREILAIDLPWIITAFGSIKSVHTLKGKNTELKINYNDNYLILIEHTSGAKGVFAVDVVTRKSTRHFEVYGEFLHILWEGTPESLIEYDLNNKKWESLIVGESIEHVEGYSDLINESPYREELKAFFATINKQKTPLWDFQRDSEMLGWIDVIETQ